MSTERPEPAQPDGSPPDGVVPDDQVPVDAPAGPEAGEPFPVAPPVTPGTPAGPGTGPGANLSANLSDADVDHRFEALTRDFAVLPGLDRRVVRSPVTDDLIPAGPRDHAPAEDDDEGFVPPDPEVHVADRRRVVAAAMILGPLVVWLALELSGQWPGPLLLTALGACVFGGAVWLVTLLPRVRDGDDPGAVV